MRGVYWFWITAAGRSFIRWFSAVVVTSFSPFFHVFPFSKSHTPAARRTGKSAKSRGEAGSEAVVCVALSKQSLCELRSMQQLPQKLHIVVEALCVLTQLQVCWLQPSVLCTVSCGVAVLASVPIDRLRSLTPAQPDVVPHPDKAGGKMGDYWTPLKKRCNIARERFCCARVTLPPGCLIRILCGALCS